MFVVLLCYDIYLFTIAFALDELLTAVMAAPYLPASCWARRDQATNSHNIKQVRYVGISGSSLSVRIKFIKVLFGIASGGSKNICWIARAHFLDVFAVFGKTFEVVFFSI